MIGCKLRRGTELQGVGRFHWWHTSASARGGCGQPLILTVHFVSVGRGGSRTRLPCRYDGCLLVRLLGYALGWPFGLIDGCWLGVLYF